jgi:hypothetical protein
LHNNFSFTRWLDFITRCSFIIWCLSEIDISDLDFSFSIFVRFELVHFTPCSDFNVSFSLHNHFIHSIPILNQHLHCDSYLHFVFEITFSFINMRICICIRTFPNNIPSNDCYLIVWLIWWNLHRWKNEDQEINMKASEISKINIPTMSDGENKVILIP